jgi:hypothetical protein
MEQMAAPMRYTSEPWPLLTLAAAVLAGTLIVAAPTEGLDTAVARWAAERWMADAPGPIAVELHGEDPAAVAEIARAAGGGPVILPDAELRLGLGRAGATRTLAAAQLLDGTVLASTLAGRAVVIDSPERATARANLLGALAPRLLADAGDPVAAGANAWILALAAVSFVLVFALALTVARARALVAAVFALLAAAGLAGSIVALALRGFVPPTVALALLVPLALVAGLLDRVRALKRERDILDSLLDA